MIFIISYKVQFLKRLLYASPFIFLNTLNHFPLRALQLKLRHVFVDSILFQQRLRRSLFGNCSVTEHNDAICIGDGSHPVRDDKHSLIPDKMEQRLLYLRLILHIERRGRLVQQDDRRILQQRSGDRDPLPFSAGKLASVLTLHKIVDKILVLRPARAAKQQLELLSARMQHILYQIDELLAKKHLLVCFTRVNHIVLRGSVVFQPLIHFLKQRPHQSVEHILFVL